MLRTITILLSVMLAAVARAEIVSEEEAERQATEIVTQFHNGGFKENAQQVAARKDQLIQWAKAYPNNAFIVYATGLANLAADDVIGSLKYMKSAYEASNHNQAVGAVYGLTLKMAGKPRQAVAVMRQLHQENPDVLILRLNLTWYLMCVQEYREALDIYEDIQKGGIGGTDEDRAIILMNKGQCELYLGQHEAAINTLEQANQLLPNAALVLQLLGEAYLRKGDTDKARTHLQQVLSINPEVPRTIYLLGLGAKQDDPAKAQTYFEKALKYGKTRVADGSDNGHEYFLLYEVCAELGLNEQAQTYRKQAANLHFTFSPPWKQPKAR